jgi:predicted CXXCH cytochrome family protein
MRKWILLLAALLLAAPLAAYAAVNDTLHDIDLYNRTGGKSGTPAAGSGGTCAYCHVPHKATGARLFPTVTDTSGLSGPWWSAAKQTPKLCYTCHGTGAAYTDAVNIKPFDNGAHLDNAAVLNNLGEALITSATVRLDTGGNLECTSCHDIHNNVTRPFIKNTGTPVAGDLYSNCALCHAGREQNGGTGSHGANNVVAHASGVGGPSSQHPTNDPATTGATAGFITINANFRTTTQAGTGTATATAWSIGGKLSGGGTGNVRCQTCHEVHGKETSTTINNNQLAVAPTLGTNSPFCEGCHTAALPAGPGAAGTTHPFNTDNTAWGGMNLTIPTAWPLGNSGGNQVLVCDSCHDVHYASPSTALYRRNGAPTNEQATALSTYNAFCGTCHSATTSPGFASHHPYGANYPVTPGTNIRAAESAGSILYSTDINWNTLSRTVGTATYTFVGTSAPYTMQCTNCHFGAGSKAHNGFSSLIANNESQLCVDCHGFNPSDYLTAARPTGGLARPSRGANNHSHYVGSVISTGYKRTTAFNGSNALAKWGTDNGTTGNIICESCHYWKNGNQQSVNNGSNPVNPADNHIALAVYGMLTASGNNNNATASDDYLCTACHGASPGGNTSHPVLPTVTAAASTELQGTVTGAANVGTNTDNGYATLNSANRVNCDSCHRPHNAMSGSGALILEGKPTTPNSAKALFERAAGTNYLNQEGLCSRCHNR